MKAAVSCVHFRSKRERRRLAAVLGQDEFVSSCVVALRRDGHVSADALIEPSLLAELAADGDHRLARVRDLEKAPGADWTMKKTFWTRMLDAEAQAGFSTDSVFVRFALQPRILQLVSGALGVELPTLSYVLLTLSQHSAEPLAVSQLWHRDHDDTRVIKLFTYLTDVIDGQDGPLTFLPGQPSDRIGFSLRSHRPDNQIFQRADRSAVRVMTAPRLSTFLLETSRCYHMGSRMAPGHQRLMFTATYVSAPSMYPRRAPAFRASGPLDRATSLVVGLA